MGLRNAVKKVVRKIVSWSEDDEYPKDGKVYSLSKKSTYDYNRLESNGTGLTFTIYPAVGGKIVQFSAYNRHIDRTDTTLYIIADHEDLGVEIGHILTKESLSR